MTISGLVTRKLSQLGQQAPVSQGRARPGTSLPLTHHLARTLSVVFSPASRHGASTGHGYQGVGMPLGRDDCWGPSQTGRRVVFSPLLLLGMSFSLPPSATLIQGPGNHSPQELGSAADVDSQGVKEGGGLHRLHLRSAGRWQYSPWMTNRKITNTC